MQHKQSKQKQLTVGITGLIDSLVFELYFGDNKGIHICNVAAKR